MKKMGTTLLAGLSAFAFAACDGGATSPDGSGEAAMEVRAVGDDGAAASREDGQAPTFQQGTAEGTVTFRARVYAQTSAGTWVELTDQASEQVTVDAGGRASSAVFASERVEAGAYSRVRVEFEDVDADVEGGVQIGTGILTGEVSVDMEGDGRVVVERSISANARADATTRLLVNLNASAWLNQASMTTRTVSEAAFRSAVTVTAE